MLDLIGKGLTERSIEYLQLVGDLSIERRTRMVQQYQESNIQVFLISMLAGGVGLNLTKADTVIVYDPW